LGISPGGMADLIMFEPTLEPEDKKAEAAA
jgi:hypothetical protein